MKIQRIKKRLQTILCWLGWHKFTCSIQDLIDEFGYIPLDNKMASNSKCKRCGKTLKSE